MGGWRGLTNIGLGIWFQEETYYPELMHGFARQTSRMKIVVVRRLYAKLFLVPCNPRYKGEPWIQVRTMDARENRG